MFWGTKKLAGPEDTLSTLRVRMLPCVLHMCDNNSDAMPNASSSPMCSAPPPNISSCLVDGWHASHFAGLGSAIAGHGAPQPLRGRAEATLALHCAQRRPRIAGLQRQRIRGFHGYSTGGQQRHCKAPRPQLTPGYRPTDQALLLQLNCFTRSGVPLA